MKVLNKVLIGVASVAMLTACASKSDYATFHSKAVEAGEKAKEVSFSKVVLSGSYVDEDGKKQSYDNVTIKFEKGSYAAGGLTDTTLAQAGAVIYLTAMQAQLVGESEYNTYYAGSSFKVVYEKDGNKETTLWNQYGLLTSVKSGSDSLKVSYKK